MHVSDGVLPTPVWAAAAAASVGLAGVLLRKMDPERIPRVALCTSFFFVGSLIHVPIGAISAHLLLIGLVGIIMGPLAFLPVLFGLVLQALLFQHGGVSAIGVNALIMGLPAYLAGWIYRAGGKLKFRGRDFLFGFLGAWGAVNLALLLLSSFLLTAGDSFVGVAWVAVAAHQPLALAEAGVTGFAAAFLRRVEPGLLEEAYA